MEEKAVHYGIKEEMRWALQSYLIEKYGVNLKCDKCNKTYHIIDLKEDSFKKIKTNTLRYLCPEHEIILAQVESDED